MKATAFEESEVGIQNAVCEYLALRGYFFWRENNTPIFDKRKNLFRAMPKWSMYGVADIILVHEGKIYALEMKKKGGSQSDNQKKFEKGLKEIGGGEYHVIHSLEELKELGF